MDVTVPKTKYEVTVKLEHTYEIELPSDAYVDENGNPVTDIDEAISIDKENLIDMDVVTDSIKVWSYKRV